jgi:hypothetical protein
MVAQAAAHLDLGTLPASVLALADGLEHFFSDSKTRFSQFTNGKIDWFTALEDCLDSFRQWADRWLSSLLTGVLLLGIVCVFCFPSPWSLCLSLFWLARLVLFCFGFLVIFLAGAEWDRQMALRDLHK